MQHAQDWHKKLAWFVSVCFGNSSLLHCESWAQDLGWEVDHQSNSPWQCLCINGTRQCRERTSPHLSAERVPVFRVSLEPLIKDISDVQSLSGPAFSAQPVSPAPAAVPGTVPLFQGSSPDLEHCRHTPGEAQRCSSLAMQLQSIPMQCQAYQMENALLCCNFSCIKGFVAVVTVVFPPAFLIETQNELFFRWSQLLLLIPILLFVGTFHGISRVWFCSPREAQEISARFELSLT